jgi:DNA helicase HerA-like ATPase
MNHEEPTAVSLSKRSLASHTFVTGSTGSGKSNTVYQILHVAEKKDVRFLFIEPAKGQHTDIFDSNANITVYGTNPEISDLLKIDPFSFPKGIHVFEHMDRLVEIFNVCWPMYAAMPAVLKEAILNSYEDCGWDLYNSTNKFSNKLFPTFADLLNELVLVINTSAYSEEVKSNYQGSLVTRVKSLNNGLCKQIFSGHELGDAALFDENVIVDLSRIGSQETKSLIMGILIMRLSEYRSNSNIRHNSELRHITILEEAHNILRRNSVEQSGEGSNVSGKSVEMISNAIAEMRTYGEGFIIVDQSPGAVDVSAIRNTNVKIIMRLPDDSDRKVAGKASGMKDNQVDEIAKLPTGVAVVYQNDWEEPVLCKIGKFEDEEISFEFHPKEDNDIVVHDSSVKSEVLKLLLKGRITEPIDANIDLIEDYLVNSNLSTFNKIAIYNSVNEFKKLGKLELWNDNHFEQLSRLVTEVLSAKSEVMKFADSASNFDQLTDKLEQYIKNLVPEIPDELTLVTSQCLMRDFSLANDVQKKIYSAWYQSVRNSKLS